MLNVFRIYGSWQREEDGWDSGAKESLREYMKNGAVNRRHKAVYNNQPLAIVLHRPD